MRFIRITDISEHGTLRNEEPKFIKLTTEARESILKKGDILVARTGATYGKTMLFEENYPAVFASYLIRLRFPPEQVHPRYYWVFAQSDAYWSQAKSFVTGGGQPQFNGNSLKRIKIPLPPLDVQKEIVAEIEGYQKVIDGARVVVDNYRPHIVVDPEWPMVAIKNVASIESGFGFPTSYQGKVDEQIPFLKVSDMNLPGNETRIVSWNNTISIGTLQELRAKSFPSGTVIFPKIGAAIATNKKRILTRESTYDNNVMGIVPDLDKLLPNFLYTYLMGFDLSEWASNAQPPSMRKTVVEEHEIPIPHIETQQAIVAEIEAEQALVDANRKLIERFEKKIEAAIARVWGEDA